MQELRIPEHLSFTSHLGGDRALRQGGLYEVLMQ